MFAEGEIEDVGILPARVGLVLTKRGSKRDSTAVYVCRFGCMFAFCISFRMEISFWGSRRGAALFLMRML